MIIRIQDTRNDIYGYQSIINIVNELKGIRFESILLDFGQCNFYSAEMCAPLGAILYQVARRTNVIQIINLQANVEAILSKNGFLSNYGHALIPDQWETTIPYQRFEPKDEKYFAEYLETRVMKQELPKMTGLLAKLFSRSIFEIFGNAVLHSKTELGIFSCGQFFPGKHCISFTIVDLGVGFRSNVSNYLVTELDSVQAIRWALDQRNTTKSGDIPGGIGLKLLCEFITYNQGKLVIVSDDGYWQRHGEHDSSRTLVGSFPGTIVNIEINTADQKSYALASEI
jgi:hypothetical protein